MKDGLLEIDYTNYKGVRSQRVIRPEGVRWGSNEWHPEPQWLMDAFDVSKEARRTFALKDIHAMDNFSDNEDYVSLACRFNSDQRDITEYDIDVFRTVLDRMFNIVNEITDTSPEQDFDPDVLTISTEYDRSEYEYPPIGILESSSKHGTFPVTSIDIPYEHAIGPKSKMTDQVATLMERVHRTYMMWQRAQEELDRAREERKAKTTEKKERETYERLKKKYG